MAFLDENGVAQLWRAMKDRLSGAFNRVDFDVAEAASNLVSGDSISTAFGKLAKNYSSILTSISDLNTSLGNRISEVNTDLTSKINTKLNKSDVLANYTTTTTGKALDASLGPAIKSKMDLVDTLHNNMTVETFQPTVDTSVVTDYSDGLCVRRGYYILPYKLVWIILRVYSVGGKIPAGPAHTAFADVPAKYRPSVTIYTTGEIVTNSIRDKTLIEGFYIEPNGRICVQYFSAGSVPIYVATFETMYKIT